MPAIRDLVQAAEGGALLAEAALRKEVHRMLAADEAGRVEIDRFLRAATPRRWVTFDESMRAYWYGERPAAQDHWWRRVLRAATPRDARSGDLLALGLASMDRDGHTREEAIRHLAKEADPLVGPFLALRTTDWVEQVSSLAVTALADRVRSDRAVLIAAAPLLFTLSDRRRTSNLEDLVLERAAGDPETLAALLAVPDTRTRRRVIGNQSARTAMTVEQLVELARSDTDTVVATTAGIDAVLRAVATDASTDVLTSLMTGPALVRRAVLGALAERAQGLSVAERYLFDRSPGVRAAAQLVYRQAGHDPALVYRAALDQSDHVPVAITELAMIGTNADHERVLGALQAEDVATRRAAANAVRWVAADRLRDLLTPLLWDPSAGVTRTAVRRLQAKASELDSAMLFELATAPLTHNRRAAYGLIRRRTAAERVEANLIALADEDELIRRDAVADLRSWLHGGAASAPRADLPTRRRMSQRLDSLEHELRRDDIERLRFHAGLRPQDL